MSATETPPLRVARLAPPVDEFDLIREVFAPLTEGAPEAYNLEDDAAALASRPGFDLVITTDAVVEGVHFLPGASPGDIARKLLRRNLSDLAAKAAEPDGYLLAAAWPQGWGREIRAAFAAGLALDQAAFGCRLLGGDTSSTRGPFVATVTAFGWVEAGQMVRRRGARVGDALLVSGTIGDAGLGLLSLQGDLGGLDAPDRLYLEARHRLPEPRLRLRGVLRRYALAAADVSDGLFADALHLAEPFGLGLEIELDRLPRSSAAETWLAAGPQAEGLKRLAAFGDDYEIVLGVDPMDVDAARRAADSVGVPLRPIGRFTQSLGLRVLSAGETTEIEARGWRHP